MSLCSTTGRHLNHEIARLHSETGARPEATADLSALKVIAQEMGDEGWVMWAHHLWDAIEELEWRREGAR